MLTEILKPGIKEIALNKPLDTTSVEKKEIRNYY